MLTVILKLSTHVYHAPHKLRQKMKMLLMSIVLISVEIIYKHTSVLLTMADSKIISKSKYKIKLSCYCI